MAGNGPGVPGPRQPGNDLHLCHHPRARTVRRPVRRPVGRLGVLAGLSVGTVLLAVLLAGCGGDQPKLPDAAAQKKASTELIGKLEALPGAKVTATIES